MMNTSPEDRGWRPIATAPKDVSTIVLGGPGWTCRGYWAVQNWVGSGEPKWVSDDGRGRSHATHWMPLPEPPLPLPAVTDLPIKTGRSAIERGVYKR